jgi:hypothetical protein
MNDLAIKDDLQETELHLIARDPTEMGRAQKDLVLWCARKIESEKILLRDGEDNLAICEKNKWRTQGWGNRIALSKKKIEYYRKIKMAIEAGYYIVPPFPVDIFAIRTKRKKPDAKTYRTEHNYGVPARIHEQNPGQLPPGDGEYRSPSPEVWQRTIPTTDKDGKAITMREYFAKTFTAVEFPFKFAKPEVLTETTKAMALKVFDQFGVLPAYQRRGDPIVVGQIIKPGSKKWAPDRPYDPAPITFFVAWWLDTTDL